MFRMYNFIISRTVRNSVETRKILVLSTLFVLVLGPAPTPEQTKLIKPKFSSFQLVPYRPTDDEVVHSKRVGNNVLVDLN